MISQRTLFLQHLGQTTPSPVALEIERAKGIYLYDKEGRQYIDLVSGVSVSNVGHCHPSVVAAVQTQAETYMHLMVYGEYIQAPQVDFAKYLVDLLPDSLQSVYFVNSGSEAIEGAMKLAKRFTGRREILAFTNAYHGSTQGALSIYGGEELKKSFQPLLPETGFLEFNNSDCLYKITEKTACVVVEAIQAEGGIIEANPKFFTALRQRCTQTGTLLVIDEIQTGFGRTGKMFAFEHYGVVPDILCLAKGMGGGMPIGAFVSSREIMNTLTYNPMLGHITTFGGHPVSCAAGLASLKVIYENQLFERANEIALRFRNQLTHPSIKSIRGKGLLLAVDLEDSAMISRMMSKSLAKGIILDYFLFNNTSFRIAPPLNISMEETDYICTVLNSCIEESME